MANISKVYLLNTPLEDDMKNTLYFANASAQQSYMSNNVQRTYLDVSYQRDTSTFRCPAQIDSIRNCNYIMFQNTAYSNKWFYGFIKSMTYVNDNFTDVVFEIDPIQTFMFDITVKPSFVEREHTNDDTVGSNTIPEDIELGEYISSGVQSAFVYNIVYCYYVVAVTKLFTGALDPTPSTSPYVVDNACIPDGCYYVAFENIQAIKDFIKFYDNNSAKDAIVSVFVCPKKCFPHTFDNSPQGYKISVHPSMVFSEEETITKPADTVGSYTPRNKKLLCYPFRYLQASNNAGQVTTYKWEDFSTSNPVFQMRFALASSGSGRIFPKNYKGLENNYDEGINLGKLPVGSWQNDLYTNWMTQNAINIPLSIGSGVADALIGVAGGVAAGKPERAISGVTGGIQQIAGTVSQIYEHSLEPPQVSGNVCNGDVNFAYSMTGIYFKKICIKPEYCRIADDFLDMFGYATHRVKTPNSAHRQNWWYTKTIDCNITGNVPNDYMNQIKQAYNNGITFWRNPSNFLNYSVSNSIV